jgi:HPt (histidine-containing phosphotransfer) domain-containing protein
MDEFLCKPLRLKALGAVLSRWLTAPQVWDAQALGRTLGHSDAKVHNRLLERFLRHTTQQLKEMQAHWQAADTQAVGALAHNIKSAARTVGALRLGELCNALEVMCEDGDQTGARALISEVEVAFHTVKGHFPAQVVSAAALET